LVFFKLGGSVITDKVREGKARKRVIRRAAREVRKALEAKRFLKLLIGHGSGSFGHYVAKRYGTQKGAFDFEGWRGYAEVSAAASRLNRLVTDVFLEEGVPVLSLQPSASALCRDGELLRLEIRPIKGALAHNLIPLIYGDVAFDELRGCTIISTEQIFAYLARELKPDRIILAGIVEGVYDDDPLRNPKAHLLKEITPANIAQVEKSLAGSYGVDVTGGMLSKVRIMHKLVRSQPSLRVRIISGLLPGLIERALLDEDFDEGTLIR
jgi:isopentenyl phosphate kinase